MREKLREKEQEIGCQDNPFVQIKDTTTGITLVALVVTIVVLLILAGITITYVFGDNSVFNRASEAKLKTDIANWQERLEMAKNPVFIEGLGTFNPDKYFDYIQQQGIIDNKDTDVIDNGDETYDVTVKAGYVFLVTLVPNEKNPTDIEIEYLGKTGNLQPKIKGIKIVEATKTSFKIKVSARLEGGEVSCYYKAKASVAENEAEDNITGYTPISLDSNLEGSVTSGLTAGTTYKVKAVLKKDGADIGWVSKEVTTTVLVTKITLNKTTTAIGIGKSEILTATIEPENAESKEVVWTANPTTVATVDQSGKVTGVTVGTATITVTAKDDGGKSATCTVTVEKVESDWKKIAEIARLVAEDSTITNETPEITKAGMTIKVGESFYVKVGSTLKEVIVLGFNHDELVTKYDGRANNAENSNERQKAGISFQFKNFITDSLMDLGNTSNWTTTSVRNYLASQIESENFSNAFRTNVKQVKKQYIKTYNVASSNQNYSNDKLWLLSCSEIFSQPSNSSAAFGYAVAKEGDRYKYYVDTNPSGVDGVNNPGLVKANGQSWWLRSPHCYGSTAWCCVNNGGNSSNVGDTKNVRFGISPGFCF